MTLLLLALLAQDPTTQPTDVLLRLPTGITITAAEYREHLLTRFGYAQLEELALDRILAVEVQPLDPASLPDATRRALADPDAQARTLVAARVQAEFGGEVGEYERFLRETGITPAQALAAARLGALREARITALVQSRRQPDEKALRRVFDERYGVDGLRVVVRHVFQSFGKAAGELRAQHVEPSAERVEAVVRERMQALWREHERGAEFAELVANGSDDPEARRMARDPRERQNAGVIPGYNFQHFGVELAEAVRAMRPGEVKGPVKTTHGYHIVRLESLQRTELASVRGELLRWLRAEPPSLQEQRLLREELLRKHGVQAAWPR